MGISLGDFEDAEANVYDLLPTPPLINIRGPRYLKDQAILASNLSLIREFYNALNKVRIEIYRIYNRY